MSFRDEAVLAWSEDEARKADSARHALEEKLTADEQRKEALRAELEPLTRQAMQEWAAEFGIQLSAVEAGVEKAWDSRLQKNEDSLVLSWTSDQTHFTRISGQ
jgi:hypothetical protein